MGRHQNDRADKFPFLFYPPSSPYSHSSTSYVYIDARTHVGVCEWSGAAMTIAGGVLASRQGVETPFQYFPDLTPGVVAIVVVPFSRRRQRP